MSVVGEQKSRLESYVETWPELSTVYGSAVPKSEFLPPQPVALVFMWGVAGVAQTVCIDASIAESKEEAAGSGHQLRLFVKREAYERVGGQFKKGARPRLYHLPSALSWIATALTEQTHQGEAQKAYCLAKSIELLCETIRLERDPGLVPICGDGTHSSADTRRLLEARRMIDERWSEKLTLHRIARACGLNRAKLTSSFREFFKCTVSEALSEKRLGEACKLLLSTDMSVSCVAYRSGYLNNASFSRAFSRRFGVPPSGFRVTHASFDSRLPA